MGPCMDELKLVALDKDDIEVVSAHVQDSLVKVSDIFWRPRERRFVMALNRFDWMSAAEMAKTGTQTGTVMGIAAGTASYPSLNTDVVAPRSALSACSRANAAISTKRQKTRSSTCSQWSSQRQIRRPVSSHLFFQAAALFASKSSVLRRNWPISARPRRRIFARTILPPTPPAPNRPHAARGRPACGA